MEGGEGSGCPAPPPFGFLQKCVFMHGSVFRLSGLLLIYSLFLLYLSLGTKNLNETGFLFNYHRGSNILTSEKSFRMDKSLSIEKHFKNSFFRMVESVDFG